MPKLIEPVLTPQDLPWGKQTDARLLALEGDGSRSLLEQNATNKGLGASVASLSEQIADLQGRVSYTASGTQSTSWTSTQPANVTFGPMLTFTLTEARQVSLELVLQGSAQASTVGGSGYGQLRPMLFLDGAQVGPTQPFLQAFSANGNTQIFSMVSARALVSIDAGTHTLQGGLAERLAVQTSGSGSLLGGSAANPSLFVDVLQLAGA